MFFYSDWGCTTLIEAALPWLRLYYPDWGCTTLTEVVLPWLRLYYPNWGFLPWLKFFYPHWGLWIKNYSDIGNRTRDFLACNDHLRHDVPLLVYTLTLSVRHVDRRINRMGHHTLTLSVRYVDRRINRMGLHTLTLSVRHVDRRINRMGLHIRRSFLLLICKVLNIIQSA
jgi:hypothetical protein